VRAVAGRAAPQQCLAGDPDFLGGPVEFVELCGELRDLFPRRGTAPVLFIRRRKKRLAATVTVSRRFCTRMSRMLPSSETEVAEYRELSRLLTSSVQSRVAEVAARLGPEQEQEGLGLHKATPC